MNRHSAVTLFADSALDPSTVPSALFVSQNGVIVPGSTAVTAGGQAIQFTPSAPFTAGAVVEIAVTSGAEDLSGNPLYPFYGSFIVGQDPTIAPPSIVQTSPVQYSSNNPRNSVIDVEFTEPLNPATVTGTNFIVYLFGSTPIAGALTLRNGDRTIHFVPDTPLQDGAYYYVYLQPGLQDTHGSPFAGTYYYFYVGSSTDTTTPTVVSIGPPNGTTGVGVNAVGIIRFSEPVNLTTVNSSTISLTAGGAVPFVLSHSSDNRTIYVTPQAPLPVSTTVTLSVINSGQERIEDPAGHAAPAASATFSTSASADTTRPSIVASSPVSGDVAVPVNSVLQVLFSEPVDPGSIAGEADVMLWDYSVGYVPGGSVSLSADGRLLTYVPPANLTPGHQYQFGSSANVLDLAGNPSSGGAFFFIASTVTDTTPPAVVAVSPPDGLTLVPRNARIQILFDEPVRATSLDHVNLLVGGSPLPVASRSLSNGNRTLTILLTGLMASNTTHTISIADVQDVAGNTMPSVDGNVHDQQRQRPRSARRRPSPSLRRRRRQRVGQRDADGAVQRSGEPC